MNLKTIEDQLTAKADKELKEWADKTFQPAYNAISSHCGAIEMKDDTGGVVMVRPWVAFEALKKCAFDDERDSNRQRKIDNFMAEVEQVKESLENLQAQITS